MPKEELKKEVEEYISYRPTEGIKDFVVYKVRVGENAFVYVVEHKSELYSSDWIRIYEGTEQECYRVVGYLDALRIEKLEKENAELKESNTYKACVKLAHQANVARDNLDKAKEIIKGLLSCCRNYPQENAEKIKQAEQFLRENDIDNAIRQANEGLDLNKIADEVEQDLNEGCPDILCKDCNKEDCIARKLGLIC